VPIERIKGVTGQRSNAIVLDYVAAATIDEDPPLLNIADAVLKSGTFSTSQERLQREDTPRGMQAKS
jgi:hypothetical protein